MTQVAKGNEGRTPVPHVGTSSTCSSRYDGGGGGVCEQQP